MPPIFVNTDNSDPKNKIYDASKAGGNSFSAEAKMQQVVIKVIEKDPTFTTNKIKDPKGYSIRLKVSKLEVNGHETKCSLSGEIVRFPSTYSKVGGSGETMVSTSMTGNASATGGGKNAVIDCIEAIAESLIAKSIPVMRADMTQR